ncbi:rhodanese-like domain-containing protein [Deinococcus multiflagellatus]|uniref:Rhodanese-like domain-containing protein n=1 Tax=Deinococcus multiflagellatus TaxID=1656887 RepID=A0ABW1ZGI3_9DEIO|nr:rhodanese-like domain-containing protein [Deinococcus multiflagellatus]MBZ9712952.1 rhodanese-like domain-containing protein [Deinococcus multiflagellatus]
MNPPPLPDGVTIIDLRPAALRAAEPLESLTERPVLAVSLDEIEAGSHRLTPAQGPLVVICERGVRSTLAAEYLRADGLDAQAYPGGVPALRSGQG